MVNRLTIGGRPCRLEGALQWQQYRGTLGAPLAFPMTPDDAAFLLSTAEQANVAVAGALSRVAREGKPVQSAIPASSRVALEMSGINTVRFDGLYIVGEAKPSNVFGRRILVADQRWWWPFNHVAVGYNLRRISGDRRIVSAPGAPLSQLQIADDVIFRASSIDPSTGQPWTAIGVLRDIMTRVCGVEGSAWRFARGATALGQGLVQDFIIDDPGQTAVNKALGLCTGLDVYQDKDGAIVIDRVLPGTYDSVLGNLPEPLDGGSVIRKIDLSLKRGAEVHSVSTREIGMRFDALNPGDTRTDDGPWLQNVLRTTDPTTTLTDTGDVVPLGTYVKADRVYEAWEQNLRTTNTAVATLLNQFPLNDTNIKRFFISYLDLVYSRFGATLTEPSFVGQRYVSEIKRGYRQRWQMNPKWVDLALRIIPKNPGFIDPETGAEAQSPVFSDYAVLPSYLAFSLDPKQDDLAINIEGGVESYERGGRLADASRAPARVVMESEQLGIFLVDFTLDPIGRELRIVPSALDPAALPSRDWRAALKTFSLTPLRDRHRMSTILTIVPGLPNSDGRFHRIIVKPADVEKRFKIPIGKCAGPVREARVGEGLATAQFPYDEAKHDQYIEALDPARLRGGRPNFDILGDPINQDALRELALSQALAEYLPRLDHYAGQQRLPFRGDLVPRGELQTIQYVMSPKGAMTLNLTAGYADGGALINPLNLLPQSARRILLRAVNPTGA